MSKSKLPDRLKISGLRPSEPLHTIHRLQRSHSYGAEIGPRMKDEVLIFHFSFTCNPYQGSSLSLGHHSSVSCAGLHTVIHMQPHSGLSSNARMLVCSFLLGIGASIRNLICLIFKALSKLAVSTQRP